MQLTSTPTCSMETTLVFLFFLLTVEGTSAQVHLSSPMAGGRACYKDQFEVTCWYPEVINGRYLVQSPGWKVNDSKVILGGTTYQEQRINSTATKVIVTVTDTFSVNTVVAYSCFLVLADTRLDEESAQQVHVHIMATPNPPVITNVTSLSTAISLNWTHNTTCFESIPLEYHVVVNTDTQPIITGEMGTVISVVSGTPYTVSVMAAVDDSQRSEPDRESVTAGHPATRASTSHQCFDRHFQLTCHHEYETTVPHMWCMDGVPVEHDGREFAINHRDGILTLMDVSQSRYAERDTIFQCCVNVTSGPQVCGEHYIFDPLEQPKAPVVTRTTEEQTSISLLWEVSKMCFESMDFTVNIFWSSASGNGQVTNVSGSSYDITGLTPGVSYDITLVAIGDGVRSDNISISRTTLSRDETLAVGTVIWIAVGAPVGLILVILAVAVLAVTGFARWWKGKHSGTYLARDGKQTTQDLTYVTVDHLQPRPINAPNENLNVHYTGVKFATEAPAV